MWQTREVEAAAPLGGCAPGVLDSLLEGCQIISRDWRYLYVNEAVAKQGRLPKEMLVGRTMMEVYPGIERTPMFSALRECMEARVPRRLQNEFVFPNGEKGWFELRFQPIPEGVFILSLETTESRRAEDERRRLTELLELINTADDWRSLLRSVLERLRECSGCEAVGIRLRDGPDFPYFAVSGFPAEFVEMENRLCAYRADGEVERDDEGQPILGCMCGNILCGRVDPSRSFFTADGCFWSNCTTELLATTSDADRQTRTRNRCNGAGYESVALIPLRAGGDTFGLVQFNDRRRGRFTRPGIALLRRMADHIANFIARRQAEARAVHLSAVLRGIRDVERLITREKDRERLIAGTCGVLVEARGFDSVRIGLCQAAGAGIGTHAAAGRRLASVDEMIRRGEMPECARQAMRNGGIIVRRDPRRSCTNCPGAASASCGHDVLVIALRHDGRTHGFMMAWLGGGLGESREERELLREAADEIAFALHGMEVEEERNRSAAALAEARERLRQAQKLEALGRLAGGVAHDFNNILMAQIGCCDLLREQLGEQGRGASDIAEIRACAERAAALTRQLLAFSRKQALRPEPLDLNEVVARVEKMLRRLIGEDIDLVLALQEGLGTVVADPGQMEQVLVNLAVNARDAMEQGGRLRIETANVVLGEEPARGRAEGGAGPHVMLAVTDTGCGMDEETRGKLFEPFFTTKEQGKGTGLGLATVYGIVKQSGGVIRVESEPGKGSTFSVCLPRIDAEPRQQAGRETQGARGAGELILAVEDDPALRDIFARMIEGLGYRVRVAASGAEALRAVEEEGLRPDLLMTDVMMPGMSGEALAEQLAGVRPGLRVLFVSGHAESAASHLGALDPPVPFLQKPFSAVDLGGKMREALSAAGVEAGGTAACGTAAIRLESP